MKLKYILMLLVLTAFFLVGCKTDNEEITQPDVQKVYDDMPLPFDESVVDTGSDIKRNYYEPCEPLLDEIPVELLRLVEQSDYENWKSKHNIFEKAPSTLKEYANIYSFIVEFDISDEDVLSALDVYLHSNDPLIAISQEDMNIILSMDESAIIERFASEFSIVIGSNIYSPQWIYENSVEKYKSAGITTEMIRSKLPLYAKIPFTEDATKAFENKLSKYVRETMSLTSDALVKPSENFSIHTDNNVFDIEWLSTHTIQDYQSKGITSDILKSFLDEIAKLEGSKEYDWIKSCYDRMAENSIS